MVKKMIVINRKGIAYDRWDARKKKEYM